MKCPRKGAPIRAERNRTMKSLDITTLKDIKKRAYELIDEVNSMMNNLEDIASEQQQHIEEDNLHDNEEETDKLDSLERAIDSTNEITSYLVDLTTYIEELID